MNQIIEINKFARRHLVSIEIEFDMLSILVVMMRDEYRIARRISMDELESVKDGVDVLTISLNQMVDEIDKNYDKDFLLWLDKREKEKQDE